MEYQHLQLRGDRDIRLLKLLPFGHSKQSLLACELTTRRLECSSNYKNPQYDYEALSYAWDGQTPDRVLVCDGKKLLVTANCEAALYQLRYRRKSRTLWIDSICINQTLDSEKSQQVQMMGDIYQQARRVIVWLGEGSQDIGRVFAHLSLFKKLEKIPWYPVKEMLQRKLALRIDKIQRLSEEEICKLPRTGLFVQVGQDLVLKDVFSRTWFKRMWTLQEVVLAKECVVQCGNATLSWDILCGLDEYFMATRKQTTVDSPIEIHRELDRRLAHARGQGFNADQDIRLSSLLRSTRKKEVTDPRDRIFALYGIFRAFGVELPPPDYSKDIAQVFREITAKAIAEDMSLTVLYYGVGSCGKLDVPSWVPDWNESTSSWYPINFFFRPSGQSSLAFEILQNGKHLCLWGKAIDVIDVYTPTLEAATFHENNHPTDAKTLLEGIRWLVELVKTIHQWLELALGSTQKDSYGAKFASLLRALLYSDMPLEEYMDWFASWLLILLSGSAKTNGELDQTHMFYEWLVENTGGPPSRQQSTPNPAPIDKSQAKMTRPRPPDPNNSEDIAAFADFYDFNNPELAELAKSTELAQYQMVVNNDAARAFQEYFIRVNRDRRFFVSRTGKMGTGCAAIRNGDQIVLFSGARQPFIVRSKGDETYQLLGPAFVDGIMYGGAWDAAWSLEHGLDKFILS